MGLITSHLQTILDNKLEVEATASLKPKEARFDTIVGDKEVYIAKTLNFAYIDQSQKQVFINFTHCQNWLAARIDLAYQLDGVVASIVIYE